MHRYSQIRAMFAKSVTELFFVLMSLRNVDSLIFVCNSISVISFLQSSSNLVFVLFMISLFRSSALAMLNLCWVLVGLSFQI